MKRVATALCALAFTAAISGAALADCPAHASTTQTQTPVKGS
ncbi:MULTISPECIES: hypothetical protein [unclassified Ancylobacter]|jgi:hypothetical protein|nr:MULTISPECIES: hypothetical protein [unclassified Ancylobacter]WAC28725.1 hypothetical protein OU996_06665 [Ancylobacter sp. SL191]WGD28901.1 hypothetical protein AncyloWKF20_14030 [Ancylobacter sp. WKF20]